MKMLRNAVVIIFVCMTVLIVTVCCLYNYNLKPVDSKSDREIVVEIQQGSSVKEIGKVLEENELVHSKNFFYMYCKIYKVGEDEKTNPSLKAGTYIMKKSMKLEEIVKLLQKGNSYNPDEITITFQEGINMRKVASIIEKNTNNKKEDVLNLLNDKSYLDSLIKDYWFLTDEIKNKDIYYSLEGYLFPNTYNFKNKDVKVRDIFKTMLDQTDKVLSKYKGSINGTGKTVHEYLTLASIVELEGSKGSDRNGIAGVFYNRLNKKMQLGSDVTTYYGAKVEMSERDLTALEINTINAYNTRPSAMAGKLPVGPIANVSEESIAAVINPTKSDYFYFVADKHGKVHFTKTYNEHLAKIKELKDKGDWISW